MSKHKTPLQEKANSEDLVLGQLGPSSFRHGYFYKKIKALCKLRAIENPYVDNEGYSVEIIAASMSQNNIWGWIELKTRKTQSGSYQVGLKKHLFQNNIIVHTWELETYNPYFGCDVSYMEWYGNYLVTIYREKQFSYVASIHINGKEDNYLRIGDDWSIYNGSLFFRAYRDEELSEVKLPKLDHLIQNK